MIVSYGGMNYNAIDEPLIKQGLVPYDANAVNIQYTDKLALTRLKSLRASVLITDPDLSPVRGSAARMRHKDQDDFTLPAYTLMRHCDSGTYIEEAQ